ncbi:hypothetical protein [Nocardia sp. NBC_01327]|uniref:hypothetical protein n=1 Tax=Nocardia sp. NBC_01327 TaxID=2903593 RepID=UPI002E137D44|nr:hypothetical protein OG326_02945 [Nocardia sp. NBC_01327]
MLLLGLTPYYNYDGSLKSPEQLAADQSANAQSPAALQSTKPLPPNVPFIPGITGPGSEGIPPITVTAQASVPVVPVTPPVPVSITEPTNRYRLGRDVYGFNYTAEQLAADIAEVQNGPLQTVLNGPTPYQRALARLAAARYTSEEQGYDLQWAFYDAQTEDERTAKTQALTRLREIGIHPYTDPAIEKYVQETTSKAQYFTDPNNPARYTAPPPPRPKMTSLGDDLYGMFVEPGVVLWEAAHGKGDHSGGEVAWAAAEFGLNASMLIPGVGAAATGARALRAGAAELLASSRLAAGLGNARNAFEAMQIGRQLRTQQVLADIDRLAIPPSHIGPALESTPGRTVRPPVSVPPIANEFAPGLRAEIPPTSPGPVGTNIVRDVSLAPRDLSVGPTGRGPVLPIGDITPVFKSGAGEINPAAYSASSLSSAARGVVNAVLSGSKAVGLSVSDVELSVRSAAASVRQGIAQTIRGLNGISTKREIGSGAVSTWKAPASGYLRRTENLGAFSELAVPMQKRAVQQAAVQAEITFKGVKITIDRNPDLVGRNLFGHTTPDGSLITLYPDAFTSMEELVKTLGHERTHVWQARVYGGGQSMETMHEWEVAAHSIEEQFWTYYQKGLGK